MNPSSSIPTLVRPIQRYIVPGILFLFLALSPAAQSRPQSDTLLGQNALHNGGTTGTDNTAIGFDSMFNDTTGGQNSGLGSQTLFSNTTGQANSGTGMQALFSNTTGDINTADGFQALVSNTTGSANTATGSQALASSTVANENTATGYLTLFANTTGDDNTASGANSLSHNTVGGFNTADGSFALQFNTTGQFNVACGSFALNEITTGGNNTALGYSAGSNIMTGGGNIDIANQGVTDESNVIRIGTSQNSTFIAGIFGSVVGVGVPVVVDANGQLGTVVSSARFKEEIKPMDKASEAILGLKPVTFRYKSALDPRGTTQFGLVAEDVEKVDPALVMRDKDGKVYTVRYDAVNAMLLNEFLKQHSRVEEEAGRVREQSSTIDQLKSTIAQQAKDIATLNDNLRKQASQIEKVSAQIATTRSEPQVVENSR
jgi:uncharacterized coiled-coil protein SlyX